MRHIIMSHLFRSSNINLLPYPEQETPSLHTQYREVSLLLQNI